MRQELIKELALSSQGKERDGGVFLKEGGVFVAPGGVFFKQVGGFSKERSVFLVFSIKSKGGFFVEVNLKKRACDGSS